MSTLKVRTLAVLVAFGTLALSAILAAEVRAQTPAVDPAATQILKRMTDYVGSLKQFSVHTQNTLEDVLDSGTRIDLDVSASVLISRPNRLRAERKGDLVSQVFYYNGKTLTLYNPADKVYATVAAPGTLEGMLDLARTQLDIVAPASDLIYRGAYDILMTDVTQGFVVGKGVVEGVRCDHLAFRAPHVDWQIWIQEGKQPLPRKLVITTRDVANAPQFSIVMTKWNLKPTFTVQTFTFTPPSGANKVEFVPLAKR